MENRAPTKPVSSPRDHLETQYLGIELALKSGKVLGKN